MFGSLLTGFLDIPYLIHDPWWLLLFAFQVWMFIDAVSRREWLWAVFIFIGFGLSAVLYFFLVYRASGAATGGFELPGTQSRARIKELQRQIHNIGNAYHYFQLGDVYFQKGKFAEAEKYYRVRPRTRAE